MHFIGKLIHQVCREERDAQTFETGQLPQDRRGRVGAKGAGHTAIGLNQLQGPLCHDRAHVDFLRDHMVRGAGMRTSIGLKIAWCYPVKHIAVFGDPIGAK